MQIVFPRRVDADPHRCLNSFETNSMSSGITSLNFLNLSEVIPYSVLVLSYSAGPPWRTCPNKGRVFESRALKGLLIK